MRCNEISGWREVEECMVKGCYFHLFFFLYSSRESFRKGKKMTEKDGYEDEVKRWNKWVEREVVERGGAMSVCMLFPSFFSYG